ncbi:hypothetical protein OCU04_008284 [Sclerotinia nivalis]|uniref:Zn(2)-C6 fungal-type domain-containing protein n=1 Tax=Sclerotinia nivalis TaxID=352851 RepID=A0A9X0AI09_9HELO|nr:hypothetical protein OCU04_008284 [Sclerotinia nivalis]
MSQRSKSGCWTCRLRRKKCNEGGPPCKDRGDKERQEANKLQLQSRRQRSLSTNINNEVSGGSTSSTSNGSTTPGTDSPSQNEFSVSPELTQEYFDLPTSLEFAPVIAGFSENSWMSSAETLAEIDQLFSDKLPVAATIGVDEASDTHECRTLSGPMSATEACMELVWPQFPATDQESGRESTTISAFPLEITGHTAIGASEKEIELMMEFIEEICVMQHDGFKAFSAAHKSWLLFLLMRSPTFYYASLSREMSVRLCRTMKAIKIEDRKDFFGLDFCNPSVFPESGSEIKALLSS